MKIKFGWFYNLFSTPSTGDSKRAVILQWVKFAAITVVALALISAIIGILGGSIITAPINAVVYGVIALAYIVPCTALAAFRLSNLSFEGRKPELDLDGAAIKDGIIDMYKNHKGVFVGIIASIALVFILGGVGFIPFGIVGFVAALIYVVPCTYFAGRGLEDLWQKGKENFTQIPGIAIVGAALSSAKDSVCNIFSNPSSPEVGPTSKVKEQETSAPSLN